LSNAYTYGSSLQALQNADQNNTKLIIGDLRFLKAFEPDYLKEAWALIYSKLMLRGQIFGGDLVKNVKVDEDKITIVCRGNIVRTVPFDKLYVFSDKNIVGLPPACAINDSYEVVDCMVPSSLVAKKTATINTEDDFVSRLYLKKKRKNSPIKLYAVSHLSENQLYDFNYSDTMAKFKSEHLLNENSFLGSHSGGKRLKISLKVTERQVDKKMDFYENTEKIKFINGS
jgi:hypothetical protein